MRKLPLLVLSLSFASPALAEACAGAITEVTQARGSVYDPSNVTPALVQLSLRAAATEPRAACLASPFVIRARDGGAIRLRHGAIELRTDFVRTSALGRVSGDLIELGPGTKAELFRTGRLDLDFLQIEAGQFVPPGDYIVDLELLVGEAPQSFQVAVAVQPAFRLLSPSRDSLSLGDVTHGAEARTTFFYNTNTALSVTAISENNGRLEHSVGRSFGSIPYSFYLSGREIDLSTPSPVTINYRRINMQSEEVLIRVEPQPARYSGSYRDVLTLQINAF